ncbi:MAG: hypothetical protein SWH61_15650 [Thermodesulfobacteriota bacterium]|nr:hypothetical protein [Thermodesulfobacteriota bacterium]
MIRLPEIWGIINHYMPKNEWTPLQNIYELVRRNGNLDDEDFEPQSPTSDLPKWKRNVRNVLQYRKRTGEIEWDGATHYRLI